MNSPTVQWSRGCVKLIDQTLLPQKLKYIYCRDVKTVWQAIKRLSVRGAPAIGVAAGYGIALGAQQFKGVSTKQFIRHVKKVSAYLGTSRPTAVNLFYAIDRMNDLLDKHQDCSVVQLKKVIKSEADRMYEEDRQVCREMGAHGAKFVKAGGNMMTVCNAGALATVDYGTALGVFYAAQEQKKKFRVYSCETRPLLQGARLTTWELTRAKIPTTLICDNMAATLMKQGKIDAIFTGADRIAANGDAANKIGTYMLAVLAKHHHVPFYVVAPVSTFDLSSLKALAKFSSARDAWFFSSKRNESK